MIKETELTIYPNKLNDQSFYKILAAKKLGVNEKEITAVKVVRRSVDARSKRPVYKVKVAVYINEELKELHDKIKFQPVQSDQKIICGGYSYKKRILQGQEYDFYFYKGQKTEEISVKERNETPWRYLFTGNVLVHRDVLNTIGFDENFISYGYEDIEWGIRLSCNYPVHHIDNSCSHLGLIPKEKAFVRMRSSIPNFLRVKTLHPELFSRTGAARISRIFSMLPDPFLRGLDKILSGFFNLLHNNFLCLFLFQLDKAVLLALRSEEEVVSKDS